MIFLLGLPIELVGEILNEWLHLKEVARMDQCLCNKSKRKILLETVYQSDLFTLKAPLDNMNKWIAKRLFKWIAIRKMNCDTVSLSDDSDWATWEEHLRERGEYVKHVYLSDLDTFFSKAMSLVVRDCPNLVSFRCVRCTLDDTALVERLFHACTKLDQISFRNIAFDTPKATVASESAVTPYLKAHSVELLWCKSAFFDVIMRAIQPEYVVKLCTDAPDNKYLISNWHNYTKLRSLGFGYSSPSGDELLTFALTQCPQVVNVDVNPSNCFRPPSTVKDLYSLNLDSVSVQDSDLSELVQRYKHSLTSLYIRNVFVTAASINEVLLECTQLRTISHRVNVGINYALMKNITKLVCGYQVNDEMWHAVQQHCRSLQHLHLALEHGVKFVESPAMIAALQSLPTLRSVSFFDTNWSMRSPQLLSVRRQLPGVKVSHGDSAKWYDLFELPV